MKTWPGPEQENILMKLLVKCIKVLLIGIGLLVILTVLLFGYRDIPMEELKIKYAQGTSSFTEIDGMNVHFRDEGVGGSTPIVLIHGTGSSLHTFDGWSERLRSDYRVVRMDLPGYGLTGPFPNRDYSIENYVDFIQHFLSARGIEKCILGGNSLGGHIAWRFAVKYPDNVDKLILIDASGYPTRANSVPVAFKIAQIPVIKNIFTYITPRFIARASVENVYADRNKVTEPLVDRYFELTLMEGNRQAFIDRFDAKQDTSAYLKIKTIRQRSLVLWGAEDNLIPKEIAYEFHKDLPNDTLVIIEDVGHVPMEELPGPSLQAVLNFLESD